METSWSDMTALGVEAAAVCFWGAAERGRDGAGVTGGVFVLAGGGTGRDSGRPRWADKAWVRGLVARVTLGVQSMGSLRRWLGCICSSS